MTVAVQPSFSAGELDPSLHGRVDQVLYYAGLRTAKNMVVNESGGIYNREGSKHIGVIKDEEVGTKLLSFDFGSGDNYVLEMGNRYLRVIRNDAYIEDPDARYVITSITKSAGSTIVRTSSNNSFQNNDQVFIRVTDNVTRRGMPEVANRLFNVRRVSSTRFEIRDPTYKTSIDSSSFENYTSGYTVAKRYEIVTPYSLAEVSELDYFQTGDIIEFVHPKYAIRELSRIGHDDWSFQSKTFHSFDREGVGNLYDAQLSLGRGSGGTITYRFMRGIIVPVVDNVEQSPLLSNNETALSIESVTILANKKVQLIFTNNHSNLSYDTNFEPLFAGSLEGIPYYIDGFIDGTGIASNFIKLRLSNTTISLSGVTYAGANSNYRITAIADGISTSTFSPADYNYTVPTTRIKAYTPVMLDGTRVLRNVFMTVKVNQGSAVVGVTYRVYLAPSTGTKFYFNRDIGPATATNSLSSNSLDANVSTPNSLDGGAKLPQNSVSVVSDLGTLIDNTKVYDLAVGEVLFNTDRSYPGVVGYYYQRTIYGASIDKPDTMFYSGIGDRFDFADDPLVTDDSAFSATLASSQVNQILSIVPLSGIIVLTKDSQWLVEPAQGSAFSARAIKQDRKLNIGAELIKPSVYDNNVVFVRKGARTLFSISYDDNSGTYVPINLSLLSKHLFRASKIINTATFHDQFQRIVTVLKNGKIAHLTINLGQELLAWTRWETFGKFVDVHSVTDEGPLYVIVKRRIDGRVRQHVERMTPHRGIIDVRDAFYVDDGLTYDNPININGIVNAATMQVTTAEAHKLEIDDEVIFSDIEWEPDFDDDYTEVQPDQLNHKQFVVKTVPTSTTFTIVEDDGVVVNSTGFNPYVEGGKVRKMTNVLFGLSHLEGVDSKNISVLADGNVLEGLSVGAGGRLDLPASYGRIHAGLRYVCEIETLDFEVQSQGIHGELKSASEIAVRLDNSRGLLYKTTGYDTFQELSSRMFEPYGAPANLMSGDVKLSIPSGWNEALRVTLRQKDPLPMGVLIIAPVFEVQDPE